MSDRILVFGVLLALVSASADADRRRHRRLSYPDLSESTVAYWPLDDAADGTRVAAGGSCGDAGSDCDVDDIWGNVDKSTTSQLSYLTGSADFEDTSANKTNLRCLEEDCGDELDTTGDLTVGCRVNWESLSGTQYYMTNLQGGNGGWRAWYKNSNTTAAFSARDASGWVDKVGASGAVSTGTWYALVNTHDAANDELHLFIDGDASGSAVDNSSNPMGAEAGDLYFGSNNGSVNLDLDGLLQDCFIAHAEWGAEYIAQWAALGTTGEEGRCLGRAWRDTGLYVSMGISQALPDVCGSQP